MKSSLEQAIALAVDYHAGQKDKGGKDFILHPLRVMLQMSTEQEMIVAVLHDVLEDTNVSRTELSQFWNKEIIDAIDSVTRNKEEVYMDYVKRAKQNPIGKQVKIQDILDNMRPERIAALPEKEQGIVNRYYKALDVLGEQD